MCIRDSLTGTVRNDLPEIDEPQDAPIIIAGFGRYGQIVGRLLYANGIAATVLEHDADQVETVRKFGWPVFYGDATRLDLLRTAGAATAKVLVLAIDDIAQSVKVAKIAREHFPQLTIVARARNVGHYQDLRDQGVERIERETLDSALMSGRSVLELAGFQPHQARTLALRFRQHNVAQLDVMRAHRKDEAKLIAVAKQGRQQLEELFAQERDAAQRRQVRAGWSGDDGDSSPQRPQQPPP
jgi:glutathione-regulated potassium-efflux system ancillary protein KefC